jgi:hypothetical protein
MPRVNRDLQRRLAARRERERRRPSSERRYRFAPAGTPVEELEEELHDGEVEVAAPVATRRGAARAAPRPYSDYAAEYAYVFSDLKRVGLVVGSLLAALIVLSFVLPR